MKNDFVTILFVIILFYKFKYISAQTVTKNLIKSPNFPLSSKGKIWRANDPPLGDWDHYKYQKLKGKTGIYHDFSKTASGSYSPGALQWIIPTPEIKRYRGNFLMSFSHLAENIQGSFWMFGKIRYSDGSYFPIYLFGDSKDHNELRTDCALIPSMNKDIEVIDISFGLETEKVDEKPGFFEKFWKKRRHIFITNAHFDINPDVKKNKCDNLKIIKPFPQRKIQPNYKVPLKKFPHNDATICLQLSIERLLLIPIHMKQYGGPFSISIYIQEPNEVDKVDELWENNENVRNQCAIHLIYRLPKDYDSPLVYHKMLNYPVNLLRNIARKYSKTEFILYLDADFVVSPNLYKRTTNGQIEKYYRNVDPYYKTMIVLPPFQSHSKDFNIPRNKTDLIRLYDDGKISPLKTPSHVMTHYKTFFAPSARNTFYSVTQFYAYSEPYGIYPKTFPLFSERFNGCFRDKVQQLHSVWRLGLKFYVWSDEYIVHVDTSTLNFVSMCDGFSRGYNLPFHNVAAATYLWKQNEHDQFYETENEKKQTVLTSRKNWETEHVKWVNKMKFLSPKLKGKGSSKQIWEKKEKKSIFGGHITTYVFITIIQFFKNEK
eukprot:gene10940-3646_t